MLRFRRVQLFADAVDEEVLLLDLPLRQIPVQLVEQLGRDLRRECSRIAHGHTFFPVVVFLNEDRHVFAEGLAAALLLLPHAGVEVDGDLSALW